MAHRTGEGDGTAPIVAELGRAETPQETADRKAAASRRHRENQTALNLVIALAASLAVMLVIVLIVVRPDPPKAEPVDFAALAAQVQPGYDEPILSPSLPEGWSANAARIETGADDVSSWYVGFLTPEEDFIGMTQGIAANPTWLAAQLRGAVVTGSANVGGLQWDIYDQRDKDDVGNLEYVMSTIIGESTVVLAGSAADGEFEVLATAIAEQKEGND